MIETIKDLFFSDPLFSAIGILGVVTFTLAVLGLLTILYLILSLIDYLISNKQKGKGKIICKEFVSEHSQSRLTYNIALKTPILTTTHNDDSWVVTIEVGNKTDDVEVTEDEYNKLSTNQIVNIEYRIGKLLKNLYVDNIDI